jgi:hypothetical protein
VCLSVYCVGCVRGEGGGGCVCVGCVHVCVYVELEGLLCTVYMCVVCARCVEVQIYIYLQFKNADTSMIY